MTAYAVSDPGPSRQQEFPATVKILVAGGFGAGKTTFIGSVSEIPPLCTEETLTIAGIGSDDLDGTGHKTTTTVGLDFGRLTIGPRHVLLLFGTPGQARFWFLWEELSRGAAGALVLADTRRLPDCFPCVDFLERRGIPFLVAVNEFEGADPHPCGDVHTALHLGPQVPVVRCDARHRGDCTAVLVALLQHLLTRPAHLT